MLNILKQWWRELTCRDHFWVLDKYKIIPERGWVVARYDRCLHCGKKRSFI